MSIYNLGRVLPIFKGEYNPTETYENLDVVLYNGSSYVAINTTTNNLPTDEDHWVLVALGGTLSPEQVEYVKQQVIEHLQSQGYVEDPDYTHTDNNFTDAEKTKLDGINMATKQDVLESGSNIKTINNESLLGSGNIEIEGVSDYDELTNKPSINGTTLEGNVNLATPEQLNAKQNTLVSGTNIKTINNESLLGSGNINIEQQFESGESVNSVSIINDLTTGGATDVLSAEMGKELNLKIEDPEPIEFQAINNGLLNWNNGQPYGTTSTTKKHSDMFATGDFKYIHYKTYISDSGAALAFYDENQNYLQSISIRGTSQTVESTIDLTDSTYSAVRYVRLGAYNMPNAYARLYSDSSLTYRVSKLETNVGVIEEKTDGIEQKVIETITANTIRGGYINPSYGTIYQVSGGIYTELISTNNYTNVYYKTSITSGGAALAFYDENQQYLRSISVIGSGPVENTIDITDSAYSAVRYVRASGYNTTPILTLYNTTSLNYKFDKLTSESIYLPSDLKVLIFGDSITDSMSLGIDFTTNTSTTSNWHTNSYTKNGNTIVYKIWPQLLAEYLGSKDVRCYAKSGAKYVDWATQGGNDNQRQKLSYQIEVALNDLNNTTAFPQTQGTYKPDVIIFALGTNDGAPNDTLESALNKTVWIDNSSSQHVSVDIDATLNNLDRTKFFEAARYAFLKMKSLYPDALFLCVLPIQRWSSNTPNMTTLHDGLKSICNYYSIPVIDGAFEMGITRDLEVYSGIGKLLKDGLHPNEVGQNVYARFVISNILNRYIKYNGMNT